jgi:hypothetical protein
VIWIILGKPRGEKQKSAVDDRALLGCVAGESQRARGYRPFPSVKKKPLNPCGVVRGVITKMPFSLLLSAETAILAFARFRMQARHS